MVPTAAVSSDLQTSPQLLFDKATQFTSELSTVAQAIYCSRKGFWTGPPLWNHTEPRTSVAFLWTLDTSLKEHWTIQIDILVTPCSQLTLNLKPGRSRCKVPLATHVLTSRKRRNICCNMDHCRKLQTSPGITSLVATNRRASWRNFQQVPTLQACSFKTLRL